METREIVATVICTIPEYHQAELEDERGWHYALTERTPGVRLAEVQVGQRYRCTVTVKLPRVLKAELIEREAPRLTERQKAWHSKMRSSGLFTVDNAALAGDVKKRQPPIA